MGELVQGAPVTLPRPEQEVPPRRHASQESFKDGCLSWENPWREEEKDSPWSLPGQMVARHLDHLAITAQLILRRKCFWRAVAEGNGARGRDALFVLIACRFFFSFFSGVIDLLIHEHRVDGREEIKF